MGRNRVWRGTGSSGCGDGVLAGVSSCNEDVEAERSWFELLRFNDAVCASGTPSSWKFVTELRFDILAFLCFSACAMMAEMFPGLLLFVMTVVTPALVANRAATIFVLIPPVPNALPAELTSAASSAMSSTTLMLLASGFVLGFLSYRQSTSVIRNK